MISLAISLLVFMANGVLIIFHVYLKVKQKTTFEFLSTRNKAKVQENIES
jgi:hypothetical protein